MKDKDRAEEGEHADIFGDVADEDVSGAEFLVGGERLAIDREKSENIVEGGGDGEGCEDYEEG